MIFNNRSTLKFLLFVIFSIGNFSACNYSFTGASVPAHLTSIAIPISEDRSGYGEPGLGNSFTDELIKKFTDDNTLRVTDRSGADAILECTITSMNDSPTVITGGETVNKRRITITVHAVYKDLVKRTTVFDKNFSDYGDYDSTQDVVTGRETAITDAVDKITEDILLGVVSNW